MSATPPTDRERIAQLEQTVQDLAACIESIVAAALIGDRDRAMVQRLLKDAGAVAAALRGATAPDPPRNPKDTPHA